MLVVTKCHYINSTKNPYGEQTPVGSVKTNAYLSRGKACLRCHSCLSRGGSEVSEEIGEASLRSCSRSCLKMGFCVRTRLCTYWATIDHFDVLPIDGRGRWRNW